MKRNEALFLLISISFLVFAWIAFNVYHSSVTSTISETISLQIKPINPDFDTSTLKKLKERSKITPVLQLESGLKENEGTTQAALTPTISPIPIGSPSASQGTPGGVLR